MKGRLFRTFAAVALALISLTVPVVASPVSAIAPTQADLAREAGQQWLDIVASHVSDLPEWGRARVASPQPYYSLDGELNAFQFTMMNGTSVVGNVLVGISPNKFHVLRASEVSPPAIPTLEEVKAAAAKLGIEAGIANATEPTLLVYTGVDGQYALYDIGNERVAVNLFSKEGILATDLKTALPAAKQSSDLKSFGIESGDSILSSGYYYLNMSAYQYGYCGPASGVSIGRYYRDVRGCSSLPSDSSMYTVLYTTMDTYAYFGATPPGSYGPGFEEMTEVYDYDNFSYVNDAWVTQDDYWTVVSNIDSGWPIGLMLLGDWHWRAIKGYDYVTAPYDWYYVITTNSQNGANFEYLEWGPDVVSDPYAYMSTIKN